MCSLVLRYRLSVVVAILFLATAASSMPGTAHAVETFEGKFYAGRGDVEYLKLLDISRRMFSPDPEFQNIAMLYLSSTVTSSRKGNHPFSVSPESLH